LLHAERQDRWKLSFSSVKHWLGIKITRSRLRPCWFEHCQVSLQLVDCVDMPQPVFFLEARLNNRKLAKHFLQCK
jgi:hypothetical protein